MNGAGNVPDLCLLHRCCCREAVRPGPGRLQTAEPAPPRSPAGQTLAHGNTRTVKSSGQNKPDSSTQLYKYEHVAFVY